LPPSAAKVKSEGNKERIMPRTDTESVAREDWHKHLEFIQNVVTRLAQNSYLLKGWTITLVAATFALSLSVTSAWLVTIAFLPTVAFAVLDAYYLRQERLFRAHYNYVRRNPNSVEAFSMDISPYEADVEGTAKILVSISVGVFYIPVALVVLIATGVRFLGIG
jgi:hypothetical protein